ncbi:calcium/sodium antiporter [Azospirillum halopraeferens]|uniref:calcium/sodium antiporter n=1 Tax=Azospirillum halopraeferens TaxID=34010 RepID=UPI000409A4A5|nr:calcium/sodium antiporter [Azospirillum halopraeferens]
MTIVELCAGLLLLLGGGEALVKGSVAVATRMGVSPLLIGLTLVGFGTSTPELMTSLRAAQLGSPGIAVGNVVGSNIANVLLILGIGALLLPIVTTREAFRRDGSVLVGSGVLLVAVVLLAGTMERWTGAVFLVLLLAYTVHTYRTERLPAGGPDAGGDGAAGTPPESPPGMGVVPAVLLAVAGIAAVVYGADLLVGASLVLARAAGLSEAVIGLTLVAVGTSLPELVTTVTAAIRRQGDVAFGNVVGSTIFNTFGILGVTAVVQPIPVPAEIVLFDIWVMLAAALLLAVFATTGWRINRWEGVAFLAGYAAYLVVQIVPAARSAVGLP